MLASRIAARACQGLVDSAASKTWTNVRVCLVRTGSAMTRLQLRAAHNVMTSHRIHIGACARMGGEAWIATLTSTSA